MTPLEVQGHYSSGGKRAVVTIKNMSDHPLADIHLENSFDRVTTDPQCVRALSPKRECGLIVSTDLIGESLQVVFQDHSGKTHARALKWETASEKTVDQLRRSDSTNWLHWLEPEIEVIAKKPR